MILPARAVSNVDHQTFVSQRSLARNALSISNRRLGDDGESNQFCTISAAVLALLMGLLGNQSQDIDIGDGTRTLTGELSEYLAQLKVNGMRLIRNDLSGQAQAIIATVLDCPLTPSESMSPLADLAAHLLHVLQSQKPRPASTLAVPVDDPPLRENINMNTNRSQSWTVNSVDSHTPVSTAR